MTAQTKTSELFRYNNNSEYSEESKETVLTKTLS